MTWGRLHEKGHPDAGCPVKKDPLLLPGLPQTAAESCYAWQTEGHQGQTGRFGNRLYAAPAAAAALDIATNRRPEGKGGGGDARVSCNTGDIRREVGGSLYEGIVRSVARY